MLNVNKHKKISFDCIYIILTIYIITAIAFEPTPSTSKYSTLAIYALFFLGCINIIMQKSINFNIYAICSILFCAYVWATSLVVEDMSTAYWVLTCTILSLIIFFVSNKKQYCINFFMYGCIIGSIILVCRIINSYEGISNMLKYASDDMYESRVGGEITNVNTIGLLLGNSILCCFTLILTKKNMFFKLLLGLCFLIFSFMLLLTGSKKSVAFLGMAIIIYAVKYLIVHNKKERIRFIVILMSLLLIALFLFLYLPVFYSTRKRILELINTLTGRGEQSKSDNIRIYMIKEGFYVFLKNPIFGNGAGYSSIVFEDSYSHNNFIELLMNYGLIGFLLYYIPYISLLIELGKRFKKGDYFTTYFFAYILIELILSIAWINYYERIPQIIAALGWSHLILTKGCLTVAEKDKNQYIRNILNKNKIVKNIHVTFM